MLCQHHRIELRFIAANKPTKKTSCSFYLVNVYTFVCLRIDYYISVLISAMMVKLLFPQFNSNKIVYNKNQLRFGIDAHAHKRKPQTQKLREATIFRLQFRPYRYWCLSFFYFSASVFLLITGESAGFLPSFLVIFCRGILGVYNND